MSIMRTYYSDRLYEPFMPEFIDMTGPKKKECPNCMGETHIGGKLCETCNGEGFVYEV